MVNEAMPDVPSPDRRRVLLRGGLVLSIVLIGGAGVWALLSPSTTRAKTVVPQPTPSTSASAPSTSEPAASVSEPAAVAPPVAPTAKRWPDTVTGRVLDPKRQPVVSA